jgi:hypothetical protein
MKITWPVLLIVLIFSSAIKSIADDTPLPDPNPPSTTPTTPQNPPTEPSQTTIYNENQIYYINSNSVKVRSTPEDAGKVLGILSLNDNVKIINSQTIYDQKYIEIKILLTYDPVKTSEKYFIAIESLSPIFIDYKEFKDKYFVVVNVATETLRIYERVCPDNSCPHRMILESEIVVGEDIDHPKEEKGKGRSILGSYRITGWSKFYQDPEGHYPSWYRDGYPATPDPDASWKQWFSKSVMPIDSEGKHHGVMRGAFGWYTAFVAPEPFGQWLHGTLGWGSDHDYYIKRVKKFFINIISDPRSSGCTRNNNEAIAFMRKFLNVGAPVIKIYAKEELLHPDLNSYPERFKSWNYVLTKNKSHAIDREDVLKQLNITSSDLDNFWEVKKGRGEILLDPQSPLNQIIEVGTYNMDIHPDTIDFPAGEKSGKFNRKLGRNGNVYGVKEQNMHGVFYVDAGMLKEYAHPEQILEISGFTDEMTPPWMDVRNIK